MALRVVCQAMDTRTISGLIVKGARQIAAARAKYQPNELPHQLWQQLWDDQHNFVNAARRELGLEPMARVLSGELADATGPS